jgi:two-component system NtrC family sensor kinase
VNNPLAFAIGHLGTVEKSLRTVEETLGEALLQPARGPWNRAFDRLREMQLGLSRIKELVLKLRTFSRLDEGERKRVSIRESVESVLLILEHRLRERIAVTTHFGEPDGVVCYASLFNQAVMNLVANAIDAVGDGGTIAITTRVEDAWFELAVSDNGCGIADGVRERVFEPFFTTKAVGQGTGLGLSITDSIARRHGGRIELSPNPGGGTIARFTFPLRE